MQDLVDEEDPKDAFLIATNTLRATVNVYSSRVDDAFAETLKVMDVISREDKRDVEVDCGICDVYECEDDVVVGITNRKKRVLSLEEVLVGLKRFLVRGDALDGVFDCRGIDLVSVDLMHARLQRGKIGDVGYFMQEWISYGSLFLEC